MPDRRAGIEDRTRWHQCLHFLSQYDRQVAIKYIDKGFQLGKAEAISANAKCVYFILITMLDRPSTVWNTGPIIWLGNG